MKSYFPLLAILFAFPAQAAQNTAEQEAVEASLNYCLEGLIKDTDPAKLAEKNKLPELPAEQAKILAGTGRAFVIRPGNTILVAHEQQLCSIMMNRVDFGNFKSVIDTQFGQSSPFRPINQELSEDGSVSRDYKAEIGGKAYVMIVDIRPNYEPGRVQAVITLGRYAGENGAD